MIELSFNPHPPFSGLPVAVLLAALCFAAAGAVTRREDWRGWMRTAAAANIILAVPFTGLAFFSGYWGETHAAGTFSVSEADIAHHHRLGRLLLFAVIPGAALFILGRTAKYHRRLFGVLGGISLLFCFILAAYTSYLGGQLVFRQGAGVLVEDRDGQD